MKPLTRRQRQVIVLAANGHTNAAIAARLGIHRNTVDRHFAEAYTSLGARDRANAVALALIRGDIGPGDIETPDQQRNAA